MNIATAELIVSSPDEVSRERLEREATLLDSVERETECEAVTEREDTYEVIIDTNGRLTSLKYAIGKMRTKLLVTENQCNNIIFLVSLVEDNSVLEIIPYKDAPTSVSLRRHLNCLDQDDPKLKHALNEYYIRQTEKDLF